MGCCGKGRAEEPAQIVLRAGVTSQDPRLDALEQFDEKSRDYPAMALAEKQEIKMRSWKIPRDALDQGNEGACVGFGITHFLIAEPDPRPELDEKFARNEIYLPAQYVDEWESTPPGQGTSVLAGLKVAKEKGFITEYRWTFSVEELAVAVSTISGAVLGLNWYSGMYNTDAGAWIRPHGSRVGRHAIFCYAVEPDKWFELLNSWGPRWGLGGRCRISFEDMDRLLRQNGEAAIPVQAKSPKPRRRRKPRTTT